MISRYEKRQADKWRDSTQYELDWKPNGWAKGKCRRNTSRVKEHRKRP